MTGLCADYTYTSKCNRLNEDASFSGRVGFLKLVELYWLETECSWLSSFICNRTAPIPLLLASTANLKGWLNGALNAGPLFSICLILNSTGFMNSSFRCVERLENYDKIICNILLCTKTISGSGRSLALDISLSWIWPLSE